MTVKNTPDTVLGFDNAAQARVAAENRPTNVSGVWTIQAFGAVTEPGAVNAAQLASDLATAQSALQQLRSQMPGIGQVFRRRTTVLRTWYQNVTARPILVGTHFIGAAAGTVIVAGYLNTLSGTSGSAPYHYDSIPGAYAGLRCGFCLLYTSRCV